MAAKKPAKAPVEKGPGRGARAEPPKALKMPKFEYAHDVGKPFAEPIVMTAPATIVPPFEATQEAILFDPSCQTCGNPVKWDLPCACCGTIAVKVK